MYSNVAQPISSTQIALTYCCDWVVMSCRYIKHYLALLQTLGGPPSFQVWRLPTDLSLLLGGYGIRWGCKATRFSPQTKGKSIAYLQPSIRHRQGHIRISNCCPGSWVTHARGCCRVDSYTNGPREKTRMWLTTRMAFPVSFRPLLWFSLNKNYRWIHEIIVNSYSLKRLSDKNSIGNKVDADEIECELSN